MRLSDLRYMFLIAVACTFLGVIGGYFLTSYQVTQSARHACTALTVLTRAPVSKPVNPKANPSREATYELYLGLLSWKEDTC